MKKQLLAAFMGLFLVSGLISCKKDYSCECEVLSNGQYVSSSSFSISNASKKDAKNACEAASSSVTSGNYTSESKCKLK